MCTNVVISFGFFNINVGGPFSGMDIRLLVVDNSFISLVVNESARYSWEQRR